VAAAGGFGRGRRFVFAGLVVRGFQDPALAVRGSQDPTLAWTEGLPSNS